MSTAKVTATKPTVSKEILAHDTLVALNGKLEPAKLDAARAAVLAPATAYPATGSVASLIFYLKFQINISGGKSFNGNAGGASTPGGGFLAGDVYTDDINRLYAKTVSFFFTATPVYTALYFYDSDSNLLGHFQGGAVSIITGTGGGSGSWS